jgi:hypothetical protein
MDLTNKSKGRFERVRTRRKGGESYRGNSKKATKREAHKLRPGGSHGKHKRISGVSARRAIKNTFKRRKTRHSKDSEQGRGTRAQGIIKRTYYWKDSASRRGKDRGLHGPRRTTAEKRRFSRIYE